MIIHSNSTIGIKDSRLAIKPGIMVSLQGPSKEIIVGTIIRYKLREASHFTGFFSEQAISLGAHYRIGDALAPSLWYEAGKLAIGVSYDVNMSSLTAASNMRGGLEVSLRFINPSPFRYNYKSNKPSFN